MVLRLILVLLCTGALAVADSLRLASCFGDSMVLQRDRPVPVWGWTDPGDRVTVTFAGQTRHAVAAGDGAWRVTLDPMPASAESGRLIVRSDSSPRQVQVEQVAVGDVWLVSGDFGAYWELWSAANAEVELPAANHPALRLLRVWAKSSNQPLNELLGEWRVCTPENVRGFSALGYFFGRALHRELGVPIGVIDASYRYSNIQGWMPPAAFYLVPELSKPRERMESWDSTTPVGQAAFAAAIGRVEAWLPAARQAYAEGQRIAPQPLMPAPLLATDVNYLSISELSLQYQGMIHPLVPMGLRGVIWSLGESPGLEWGKSRYYLEGLIRGWRRFWGQGDFPFYLELVPRHRKPDPAQIDPMREGQLACRSLPNTGVVVTYDVSDYESDSRNRQDPGERFARLALAREYGRQIVDSGPVYLRHRIEGERVVLEFEHVGKGLVAGEKLGLAPLVERPDGILHGFALAGEDRKWHWAEARVEGDTVVASCAQVPAPVAARYGMSSDPHGANLYNRDGLPAVPFRTDTW